MSVLAQLERPAWSSRAMCACVQDELVIVCEEKRRASA